MPIFSFKPTPKSFLYYYNTHPSTPVGGDQEEEKNDVEVEDAQRHISSSSFLPQRITRTKAKELGSRLQMFSLFVVSFV